METIEERRIKVFYAGVQLDSKTQKSYIYWVHEENKFLAFDQKLIEVPIGVAIEITRTETGVKSPYKPLWSEPKHQSSTEWWALDAANRKILQAKSARSKDPELVQKFERILDELTESMTRTQKQAFLMKYLLNLK